MKKSNASLVLYRICCYMAFALAPLYMISGQSLSEWKKIETIEDVFHVFPDRMEMLLQKINLNAPGLEAVKKASDEKQTQLACKLLLDYYQKEATRSYLRIEKPQVTQAKDAEGDLVVQNIITFYNQQATVPCLADGHIDWTFRGPTHDLQWELALNRHYYLQILLKAYRATGNPLYARTIDLHLKDWIIASLPYPAKNIGLGKWNGLEVQSRVKQWATLFYALNNTDYLSPATQLLILSSLPEHAHYLRNFHAGGNWLTMELSALATVATAWPEFKESQEWLQYAVTTMTKSLEEQVYIDGAQKELTSSYHTVALNNFSLLLDICKQANHPLPDHYGQYIEKMWNYLACTMLPNGYGLLNNDSDLNYNREAILRMAALYRRDDWKHIATNGKEGVRPAGGPSFFFPWAGQLITRSGYDTSAHWAFFDMGPWGIGHQHNDKLHLSVAAYGYDFLVDAGRFSYDGEIAVKFRNYALSSAGHNVILVDGKGQAPGPKQVNEPLADHYFKITDPFDYGWSAFNQFVDVTGVCEHSRSLLYVRGAFWVVVDKITTDQPRTIETLWHWHPACTVSIDNKQVVTGRNDGGFLHVIPVGATQWSVSAVKGRETPSIQGWYSREYNEYEPNVASIYTTGIQKESVFVWLLYPSKDQTIDIKATVISENSDSVIVQVNHHKEGQWTLHVPFADSSMAMVKKL